MNQGVHGIDLILWMLGDEVSTLYGRAETLARDIPVEDTAAAVLNMKHGGICVIQGLHQHIRAFVHLLYSRRKGTVVFNDEGHTGWKFLDKADAPQRPDMGERVGGAGNTDENRQLRATSACCAISHLGRTRRPFSRHSPQEAALAVRVICSILRIHPHGRAHRFP